MISHNNDTTPTTTTTDNDNINSDVQYVRISIYQHVQTRLLLPVPPGGRADPHGRPPPPAATRPRRPEDRPAAASGPWRGVSTGGASFAPLRPRGTDGRPRSDADEAPAGAAARAAVATVTR